LKYPIADICDRLSIEQLKEERIPNYRSQFRFDAIEYISTSYSSKEFLTLNVFLSQLYEWNGKIWDLESDIRKGKEGELGLEEVGRRAIAIRELNNKRIEVKNQIAENFKEYLEVKFNHASE